MWKENEKVASHKKGLVFFYTAETNNSLNYQFKFMDCKMVK